MVATYAIGNSVGLPTFWQGYIIGAGLIIISNFSLAYTGVNTMTIDPIFTCPECNEPIEIGYAEEYGHKTTCPAKG